MSIILPISLYEEEDCAWCYAQRTGKAYPGHLLSSHMCASCYQKQGGTKKHLGWIPPITTTLAYTQETLLLVAYAQEFFCA